MLKLAKCTAMATVVAGLAIVATEPASAWDGYGGYYRHYHHGYYRPFYRHHYYGYYPRHYYRHGW